MEPFQLFKAIEWYGRNTKPIYTCTHLYEGLDWHEDNKLPKPTLEDLHNAWTQFSNDFDRKEYQRKRQKEYPPIEAQLDVMYNEGYEGWFKLMRSIKQKYPSPHKDKEPDLVNPMEALNKRVENIEATTTEQVERAKQELAALQAAIIDTKGAIYAIKGFMMEIPTILAAIKEIKEQLGDKDASTKGK